MTAPAEFALRRSALQVWLLLAVHGGAGALVLLLPLPLAVHMVLLTVLGVALAAAWRQRSRLLATELIALRGERWLVCREGREIAIAACRVDYLSRWLVVLALRAEAGDEQRLPIFSDALSADDFRRLRVLLRKWPGVPGAGRR